MKIPEGMTESEVVEIFDKIARRVAPKFRFGYYEADDIEQEARILCMDALERYDNKRPLENFLYTHVYNRLCTLKRDKYERLEIPCKRCPFNAYVGGECIKYQELMDCKWYKGWVDRNESKKNLMNTVSVGSLDYEEDEYSEFSDALFKKNVINLIDNNIPFEMRKMWLEFLAGVSIPKENKKNLFAKILEILRENNYQIEGEDFGG